MSDAFWVNLAGIIVAMTGFAMVFRKIDGNTKVTKRAAVRTRKQVKDATVTAKEAVDEAVIAANRGDAGRKELKEDVGAIKKQLNGAMDARFQNLEDRIGRVEAGQVAMHGTLSEILDVLKKPSGGT
jgi:hypothetical protein